MREAAEAQVGNRNYLLLPCLKLCLHHQLRVILREKTLSMMDTLLPWPPCRVAQQAGPGMGDLLPASFQPRNMDDVIRADDQPSRQRGAQ